ncbi:MAG: permease [Alphaproteobacteria bacterium]|nr:permease [Alphaproteobacteria bacterium]
MKCKCQTEAAKAKVSANKKSSALWIIGSVIGIALWFCLYNKLVPFSKWIVAQLPVEQTGHLYEALTFFFYDTPKVLLLLTLVVFLMGIVRSFFSPERTRALLVGKNEGLGNIAAACLGVVTPFCSCSAVPLFIGFVSAGVPLGVTFSFLIAAPMVNEVALVLLFGLVGWKVALLYLVFGLGIAIVAGWVIGRFHLESWLEDWVQKVRTEDVTFSTAQTTVIDRIKEGLMAVRKIVGKVWLWMIAGIAIGAFIHGYVPVELLVSIMGKDVWWSVPASVLVGIPMYSNAAGIIPIVEALLGKGAALGTVLSFMMAVTALSLPEAIILRKVLTTRLIAVYFCVVCSGILAVGYLFNVFFI